MGWWRWPGRRKENGGEVKLYKSGGSGTATGEAVSGREGENISGDSERGTDGGAEEVEAVNTRGGNASRLGGAVVTGSLTRYFKDQYKNMRGRELRACVVENSPYFRTKILANGTLYPGEGIDVNLLNILADKMNFT